MCDTKGDLELELLEGIASIVDKSLAQQMDQAKQEPLRDAGNHPRVRSGKIGGSGEETLTRRAHAAYCLVLAEEPATGKSGENGWNGSHRT